jgi:hypothetical protein
MWIDSEQKMPEPDTDVLIWNEEGIEIALYSLGREDSIDEMGHDAGWIGLYAFPGRSFGNGEYQQKPHGQARFWMALPETPEF